MYPTSRTSFAAVLGIVGMFLLTLSTAFGWNPEIINGVQYIPMSEVRTHYKLTRERTEGRQKVYEVPEKIQIRIQARSQDMFMNNMKFVLSYPVADHPSKGLMVSNMDLHKIIDPVLRPTYIANRRSFNTVVIDPGHGGHDSGTRNRISREADINLSVGKKLRDRLKTMGYQVVMTRDTDNFIALQDRVRIANRHNNAIFISIHFNDGGSSARDDALQGNAQDSMNIALATAVQGHMLKGPLAIKEGISMVDRGIKRARYSVLCTIKHPAILVEGGFMSNPQEALLIATERYQNFMASSLAAAVHQYRTALGQQVRRTR